MQKEIGLAIRLARVASGKTQSRVAAELGLHPVVLNYIERGKRLPNANIVKEILKQIKDGAPRSHLVGVVLNEAEKVVRDATS